MSDIKPVFCNRDDKAYQKKLNALLSRIFLDFSFWYDLGLWDENYESWAFEDNGEIVANICVYKMQVVCNGERREALSLGAIATKKEYRGLGLQRQLFERVLNAYPDMPAYLSANETVLDFYPRFGFRRTRDYLPVTRIKIDNDIASFPIAHDDPAVARQVYSHAVFSERFDCLNAQSVNMFHLYSGEYDGHVYELPGLAALAVATQNGPVLTLHALLQSKPCSFAQLAAALPFHGVDEVQLGFTPRWDDVAFSYLDYDSDPLFVRNVPSFGPIKFPDICFT